MHSSHSSGIGSVAISKEVLDLEERVKLFINDKIIPLERKEALSGRRGHHGPTEDLRNDLVKLAKDAGLVGNENVQRILRSHTAKAVVFEAAGYSMLGPVALNIAAPDEGNMHLLEKIATEEQKRKYLHPLVNGDIRSCFAMTEPSPGAGSDPAALKTIAVPAKDGKGGWIINGDKWLITGSTGASFAIIMAQTQDDSGKNIGASMFLADMNSPAIETVRVLDTMDTSFTGGHGHIRFNNLRVGPESILGKLGEGFNYAQVRLAPARLTHCMRWLGAAKRAHDIASKYACERQSFGKRLIDHQGISFQLADNEMDLLTSRLHIRHCASILDEGLPASMESRISKVVCSEAIFRIVDRSMQILGGMGVTQETEIQAIFRDVRAFRIYDGASEVHRMSIGKDVARRNSPKDPSKKKHKL